MRVSTLAAEVDLGEGHRVKWIWTERGAIPAGVVLTHGRAGDECRSTLMWASSDPTSVDTDDDPNLWTMISLNPLTILEPLVCDRCRASGRILAGRWHSA